MRLGFGRVVFSHHILWLTQRVSPPPFQWHSSQLTRKKTSSSLPLFLSISRALDRGGESSQQNPLVGESGGELEESLDNFLWEEPSRRRTMILTCRKLASLSTFR